MVRTAFLLGSLNRGGTETLLLDVFRSAVSNGLNAIGIYRKSGRLESEFRKTEVPFFYLPVNTNIILYLLRLRKLLVKNKVNVVHAQQPLDAFLAYWACIGTSIKIILTFHGYDFQDKGLNRLLLKYIIKRTDTNIFVSSSQKLYYQRKFNLKCENQNVLYNGISFDKLDLYKSQESIRLRKELNLSNETVLFGTVGNFNIVRDQITICRFLKLLKRKFSNFHFVFVGKRVDNCPEKYDACVEYCSQNALASQVSFLGSRDDVPYLLGQLDAFIYSTDHDTFGIAVVEAMATGIPVFVNSWEVMNEITANGKYATLYETKNEEDLVQQFMLFLQNKTTYIQKAKEASVFVRETYSIEQHIAGLKEIYERVLNE